MTLEKRVKDYLQNDRQWKHEHRIGHAKLMHKKASDEQEKEFWKQVLEANGVVIIGLSANTAKSSNTTKPRQ